MNYIDNIHGFPDFVRKFFLIFTICLSIGYFSSVKLARMSTDLNPKGIEENYLGNKNNKEANVMRFKKSRSEIMTIIHTHILSFSLIFFCLGAILISIPMNLRLKKFLLYEPFVSTIVTFGGIWLLWKGYKDFKYLIIFSGGLLTCTFVLSVFLIFKHTLVKQ